MSGRLSDRIRQARKHIGLSATEAAKIAGLTRKSWERYELDKNEPKASSLMVLVDHGIDAHWLLKGEGNMIREESPKAGTGTDIDEELLKAVITEIDNYRERIKPRWDYRQTSRIIALGYLMLESEVRRGLPPDSFNLQLLMEAVSI